MHSIQDTGLSFPALSFPSLQKCFYMVGFFRYPKGPNLEKYQSCLKFQFRLKISVPDGDLEIFINLWARRWGGGLPRDVVRVKVRYAPRNPGKPNSLVGYPGILARISRGVPEVFEQKCLCSMFVPYNLC